MPVAASTGADIPRDAGQNEDRSGRPAARHPAQEELSQDPYVPPAPSSFAEARISPHRVEALALKVLLNRGAATGREIASQIALPYPVVEKLLHGLKTELLVVFKNSTPLGDYLYELTQQGIERARTHAEQCTYCGAAPVALDVYCASVEAQSVRKQRPKLADLRRAFDDLVLSQATIVRIGEAVNAGLSLFLCGSAGNGKTSIAARVTQAYGRTVWIPRAVDACGEVIRIYDSSVHEAVPFGSGEEGETDADQRWVRIRRPTVFAGGELTMDQLEVTRNPNTGIIEAPLQVKSNCGTLVIDDFGRQRISSTELLNRWIVPLEKRQDLLSLPSGRKFEVPFDQLLIFSTNLKLESFVEEAFLRRIPYKINVADPSESEFREVFRRNADALGLTCSAGMVDYLLEKHYRTSGRDLRFCQPYDLLHQVYNACQFRDLPLIVTKEAIDAAVQNFFAPEQLSAAGA
jgi:predicted ATPase with chaperone activity